MFLLINIVIITLLMLAVVGVLLSYVINTTNYRTRMVPITVKSNQYPRNRNQR
ncbi:hypothetical protein [Periweissella ghanensis]|uniref:NADH dehydrogenase subunit 3 n=1 Tax=Periweissella ghanensis TaxID=467997 RepID=A0ABM8ZEL9_9LACO|nr:hypothetical protein [Periweissella ghanensis]MCM0601300.1 hypothetical protein [Periweissella ghanensis]CAH0419362.1 hypothetical protein WGH24286_01812 [Periweissella ghanensis]